MRHTHTHTHTGTHGNVHANVAPTLQRPTLKKMPELSALQFYQGGPGAVLVFGSGVSSATKGFQHSLTGKDDSCSGFGSWKTVPAVPVPLSVSGSTELAKAKYDPPMLPRKGSRKCSRECSRNL